MSFLWRSDKEPWYVAMEREKAEEDRTYLSSILDPWEMDDSPEHLAWLEARLQEEIEEARSEASS